MKLLLSIAVILGALSFGLMGCKTSNDQGVRSENANKPEGLENKNGSANNDNSREKQSTNAVDRYRINAGGGSSFSARVGVGGLLSALGHEHTVAIRDFTGEADLTPGTIEPASLQLTIKSGSLVETDKTFSESDRQKIDKAIHEEALETAKHPQIVFKSTRVSAKSTGEGQYQVQINGELTLHGVTRPVTIPAQVTLKGNTVTARGEFIVRHSDYQMKRISAGAGTVKAKEEITLSFNFVGSKT